MKNLLSFKYLAIFGAVLVLASCQKKAEDDPKPSTPVNKESIIEDETKGRPNYFNGCVEIENRATTIEVWDHGQVDGDIISLIVNNNITILDEFTLEGPDNKKTFTYTFPANGANSLTLYAHNEGDISPNTATISINGEEFVLESYLTSNGYVDIVVLGYGVSCPLP